MTQILSKKIEEIILSYKLLAKNEKVLLGVSGGADSLTLLYLLKDLAKRYSFQPFVIHVNHMLRGKESYEEEDFVTKLCEDLRVPFKVERVDVLKSLHLFKNNVQATARYLRYNSFLKVAKEEKVNKLFLAHHADDQVETVLYNFLRGTSITGLGGIKLQNSYSFLKIIRPLLFVTKEDILLYCKEKGIKFVIDSSNLDKKYMRNKIRLELIPFLKKNYNPKICKKILDLSKIASEEDSLLQKQTKIMFYDLLCSKEEKKIVLDVLKFRKYPFALQRRLCKFILDFFQLSSKFSSSFDVIENIREAFLTSDPSFSYFLASKNLWFFRKYNYLYILVERKKPTEEEIENNSWSIALNLNTSNLLPYNLGSLDVFITDKKELNLASCFFEVFDFNLFPKKFELIARSRLYGDKMTVFKNGCKKLKKLFIDKKIPRLERFLYPVIVLNDQIIWVAGVARSSFAPISFETKSYIYFIWKRKFV